LISKLALRKLRNSKPLDKFLAKVASLFYICSRVAAPAETAEPIVDLLNRGVSSLTAKRGRPEMAPQRLEKIESRPGNGMGSEASDPQDLVRRLTVRGSSSRASRTTKIPVLGSCRKRRLTN
jgi:hypothetical protein